MREAYSSVRSSAVPPAASAEMARNLVFILRATEKDWEHDPLLNDPQVHAALVEETQ
jgi:hypothetical protein